MSKTKTSTRLRVTKNYDMFDFSPENRPADTKNRRDLRKSMQTHGFIPAYPLHCVRNGGTNYIVKDGQNRLRMAQELGISVWYVICDDDANISEINNTQRRWSTKDYAESFAAQGFKDYIELLEFADTHKMPIWQSACILASSGRINAGQTRRFREGKFKIRSREMADRIARIYRALVDINRGVGTKYFICALFAACCVKGFDDERLIKKAKAAPELLETRGERDGYLSVLENIYNRRIGHKFPLRVEAENAMRKRHMLYDRDRKSVA